MAEEQTGKAHAAPKTKYRVREGFFLHLREGGEPLEGGAEIALTDEDADFYAVQIELADPAKIKAALAAEKAAAQGNG